MEVSKPTRSSMKNMEEEKKDVLVNVHDIMEDVYDMKFGDKKRRNPPKKLKADED